MCHGTEYQLPALQANITEENKLNATTQQFTSAKISACALTHGSETRSLITASDQGCQTSFEKKSQTMSKKSQTGLKKAELLKTMKFLPFPCVTMLSPRWSTKRIAL